MEQNNKWYAEKYCKEYWIISATDPKDENLCTTNVLDTFDVGEQQAEKNAKLCAAAPEMRQLVGKLHWWLSAMLKNYPQHEKHSVYKLLEECEELDKKLTTHE
jgi:hypothetical protein